MLLQPIDEIQIEIECLKKLKQLATDRKKKLSSVNKLILYRHYGQSSLKKSIMMNLVCSVGIKILKTDGRG